MSMSVRFGSALSESTLPQLHVRASRSERWPWAGLVTDARINDIHISSSCSGILTHYLARSTLQSCTIINAGHGMGTYTNGPPPSRPAVHLARLYRLRRISPLLRQVLALLSFISR